MTYPDKDSKRMLEALRALLPVPPEPVHAHQFWTTGGAWRCDCGATQPRLIGPGV